jgi:phosphoglucosamine mutase
MKHLFGTDGIRGRAGEYPLDAATIVAIGAATAREFRARLGRAPRFVAGRDTRESGTDIEAAFHSGAASEGATVSSAGVITTPGVAYLTAKFDFDAGVVISASHNPYYDNGMKIFLPSGQKVDASFERTIEANIGTPKNDVVRDTDTAEHDRVEEYHNAYVEHLKKAFKRTGRIAGKIVIDCANGASCSFAKQIFTGICDELIVINDVPDGRNINEKCGSLHLEGLREAVISNGAAIGIAFDGDADRVLFVDERGSIVDGDATLWILANHLLRREKLANRCVVATVMSNVGLEIALRNAGIELMRADVGDKYVLEQILKTGSEVGGEQSGHIIFPENSLVGDGMMTALLILASMMDEGKSLSELASGFEPFPQILVNVPVARKLPFDDIEPIRQAAAETSRELDGHGRLLLRYSGTENLARVMIEGRDQGEIERIANRLADVIRQEIG